MWSLLQVCDLQTGVTGKLSPKMAISSSSSFVKTPSPPVQPQPMSKKPPTLLSLASPVLTNPQASLYPSSSSSLSFSPNRDDQLIATELNSSFFGGASSYHRDSSSPDIASDNGGADGDKYAVFRELQSAEPIPGKYRSVTITNKNCE